MNVLIADDDRITREGVVEFIDWASLGATVIASAKDGREALDIIINNDVDILVTDIRMPYLTGFELVKSAGSKGRFPATIIISGYDDYEYLQQAIKLHIILGYIFKPIQPDQLYQLLKDAVAFRKEWLANAQIPELTAKDLSRYSYKNIVVNLRNLESVYLSLKEDLEKARSLFEQSWSSAVGANCSVNFAKRFAWEFSLSLMQLLAKDNINSADVVMGADPLSLISALDKKSDIYNLLLDLLESIHTYLQLQVRYSDPKIACLRQALDSRFSDCDLNLQLLAGELNVTANYLGALYKKERGESFNAELLNRRIDVSKQLLITTNKKVCDVAAEVGFSDPKYFAVAFRKAVSLTPSEFRARYYRGAPL